MDQVLEHLQRAFEDRVRLLALDVRDEAHAAGVAFVVGAVQTVALGEPSDFGSVLLSSIVASHCSPTAQASSGVRSPAPFDSSAALAIAVRSTLVDSTTLVSVRSTPSIERRIRISASSDCVSRVLALSSSV